MFSLTLGIKNMNNNSNFKTTEHDKQKSQKKIKVEDPFPKFKQKTTESTKTSLNSAITTSKNINQNIRSNIERAKESISYKDIHDKLCRLEKTVKTTQTDIRKNSPRFFIQLKNGFLAAFEQIVGRIRIGTQYGTSSMNLLSDLAKLKELGILTEDEFNLKKKELLDRI